MMGLYTTRDQNTYEKQGYAKAAQRGKWYSQDYSQYRSRARSTTALSEYGLRHFLAWTFMGYSFAYILFSGLAEVMGAWLLLWQRTKLLGVAVLLPIMVNILVFDVIFLDTYGALASATIYTLLLFIILVCNKERVGQAIRALIPRVGSTPIALRRKMRGVVVALVLMGLLFAVDQMLVNLFGHGRG